jgi:hypothetical protein
MKSVGETMGIGPHLRRGVPQGARGLEGDPTGAENLHPWFAELESSSREVQL